MALEIKAEATDLDLVAKKQTIADITGGYDAATNTGGYGVPNPERADLLLYLIAVCEGVAFTGDGDPATANAFDFVFPSDGAFEFYLVAWQVTDPPASLDPALLLSGAAFVSPTVERLSLLHLEAKMISLLDLDTAERGQIRRHRNRYMVLEKALLALKGAYSAGNPLEVEKIINQLKNLK